MSPAGQLPDHARRILTAGIEHADGMHCVSRHLRLKGRVLSVGPIRANLDKVGRVRVVGAGKAAGPMAQAVERLLGGRLDGGLVIVPHGTRRVCRRVEEWPAAHPLPDEAGVQGTQAMLELLADSRSDDLVIVLISGGASSLLVSPAGKLTLDDLRATNTALLASGADIGDINTMRRHLSQVKGGWLAAYLHPASVWALVLSDVVGDDLGVVGSGPTVPDPSTAGHALAVVEHYGLRPHLPSAVVEHLEAAEGGHGQDTPRRGNPWFDRVVTGMVGNIAHAAGGAEREAVRLGFATEVVSVHLQGEAKHVGATLGARANELQCEAERPTCLLFGGETTVTLGEQRGQGGRNQEVALAAAREIAGLAHVVVFSIGTDGVDGPTTAAGGLVDGDTWPALQREGLDGSDSLLRHDSHTALDRVGAVVYTGPTRTNVMDLMGILVVPRG